MRERYDVNIKVLGSGCAKCNNLEELVKKAVAELGVDATIEHVTDFAQIMQYGIMSTPALVIDEQVKFAGQVPPQDKIVQVIAAAVE